MSKYMYFYTDGKVVYHDELKFSLILGSCAIYRLNDDGYYKHVVSVMVPENK